MDSISASRKRVESTGSFGAAAALQERQNRVTDAPCSMKHRGPPYDLLEEIRLLSNLETATVKLLNVVLAGQPELAGRLNEPNLRQLKQRIALRCELAPLNLSHTASYIAGRIRVAGGTPVNVFTREAISAIYSARRLPRVINVICQNASSAGSRRMFGRFRAPSSKVCRDFDVRGTRSGIPRISNTASSFSHAGMRMHAEASPKTPTISSSSLSDW